MGGIKGLVVFGGVRCPGEADVPGERGQMSSWVRGRARRSERVSVNEGSAADIHFDPARAVNGRFRRENGVVKSSSAGRARRRSLFVASTAQFPTRVPRLPRFFRRSVQRPVVTRTSHDQRKHSSLA